MGIITGIHDTLWHPKKWCYEVTRMEENRGFCKTMFYVLPESIMEIIKDEQ